MCGIIGYSGPRDAQEVILRGLDALSYRGYDSAGLTAFENGSLRTVKAVGKLTALSRLLEQTPVRAHTAIGHTRWATHGAPTDYNSHPHGTERVMLVHNGIIENYAALKQTLLARGYTFCSETDTEVAATLIDSLYDGDPVAAIRAAIARIRGAFAFGIVFADYADRIYAVRRGSPLIVGVGEGEHLLASDVTAVLRYTKRYIALPEEGVAEITAEGVALLDRNGRTLTPVIDTAAWSVEEAERGGYPHFMKKEIFEEPSAIRKTLLPRLLDGMPHLEEGADALLSSATRLTFVGCGTAMHAALLAKRFFEKYARLACRVEIASELRYADPVFGEGEVMIVISQSGETADTLAALREARSRGVRTLAVVNAVGSTIAREADCVLYTYAGPEIAVASTKAYTVQVALLALLSVAVAHRRGLLDGAATRALCQALSEELPRAVECLLLREGETARAAAELREISHLFFLGRLSDYAVALEASLKLKEISYIHSEAYAAGEMKHGTISLIEQGTPVVVVATEQAVAEKTLSNLREVTARGASPFVVTSPENAALFAALPSFVLPRATEALYPILAASVLQLYAYHAAVLRGCAVDQPRNLAKSVTVE